MMVKMQQRRRIPVEITGNFVGSKTKGRERAHSLLTFLLPVRL